MQVLRPSLHLLNPLEVPALLDSDWLKPPGLTMGCMTLAR